MIALVPIALATTWMLTAWAMGRSIDDAAARRLGVGVMAGSIGVALIAGFGELDGVPFPGPLALVAPGFMGIVPFTICVIGLVAVGLSESISHARGDLRAALVVLAVAMYFVSTDLPSVAAVCWVSSASTVWWRLRVRFGWRGVSRLFAIFQVPSVLLFVLAMVGRDVGSGVGSALMLMAAMGIREAVMPGHSWFVRFVEEAPMALVIAFVAPQLGVYSHLVLLEGHLAAELTQTVAAFGAATAVIAAALGLAQTSARRALAYLMMSQTGLVAFGLEGVSEVGLVGSLLAWQVLAVATSGFAMTLSALEARRGGHLGVATFSGCFARTPRMAGGFLMMGLASVGFPMTLGFVAEDLLVQGSVGEFPVLSLVLIVATALNGMNVMRSFFRLFSGRREHSGEADLTGREAWALSVVLLALLVCGLAPGLVTSRGLTTRDAGLGSPAAHSVLSAGAAEAVSP